MRSFTLASVCARRERAARPGPHKTVGIYLRKESNRMEANKELTLSELLDELRPEELEPRLELQVLVDPLGLISDSSANNNCEQGGNCNVKETST